MPHTEQRIATNFVGFEGHEYLRSVAAGAHASLILHGHHHASTAHQAWAWRGRDSGGPGDARIVSAGSWGLSPESGKLPKDQPVVMQLIRLDPGAAELHAVLLTYDPNARLPGDVRLGRFVLDPQTRSDRPLGLSLPPALRGRFRSDGASERVADPRPRLRAPDVAAAVAAYRTRKAVSFVQWELRTAGPQPTVGHRPVAVLPGAARDRRGLEDCQGCRAPDRYLSRRCTDHVRCARRGGRRGRAGRGLVGAAARTLDRWLG